MNALSINDRRLRIDALEAHYRIEVSAQLDAWVRWKRMAMESCKSIEYRGARAEWETRTRACFDLAQQLSALRFTTDIIDFAEAVYDARA